MAAAAITSVECQSQVKSWRLFRSLLAFLIPTCNCTNSFSDDDYLDVEQQTKRHHFPINIYPNPKPSSAAPTTSSTLVTGTIFGSRRGKISLCFQTHRNSITSKSPTNIILLLLELTVPTPILAREMQTGVLRISLRRSTDGNKDEYYYNCPLLSVPAWTTYCNGRKAGNAVRRRPTEADLEALRLLNSVAVGAGVIREDDDEVTYLRANFQRRRVSGGSGAESFHLVDPDGSIGQELSIFFFR